MRTFGNPLPSAIRIGYVFLILWTFFLLLVLEFRPPLVLGACLSLSEFFLSAGALLIALVFPFLHFQWARSHKAQMFAYFTASVVVAGVMTSLVVAT